MSIDVLTLAVSALVSAVIQGGVGALIWFAVRRNVELVDRLRDRIETIESDKIAALSREVKSNSQSEIDGRRRLHEEITFVRTHFVHSKTCEKMMGNVARGMEKFAAAASDLGGIQKATEINTREIGRVAERIAGLSTDLARMEGRNPR
jgi:hypothetical protein